MYSYAQPVVKLIEEFEKLPGIGHKSAQRLAFHMLNLPLEKVKSFSESIINAKTNIRNCTICCNLTDVDPCNLCNNSSRDNSIICVVENAKDVAAMERTREYKGQYHVLHGAISPMDRIGPNDIKINELL